MSLIRKITIVIATFVCLSSQYSLASNYRLVVVTAAGDEFYFDPKTVSRTGDVVSVDVLMSYGHADPFNKAWSSVQNTKFDCKTKEFQIMNDKFFSQKMGKGKVVQASNWPMPKFEAPEGSTWRMVLELVC